MVRRPSTARAAPVAGLEQVRAEARPDVLFSLLSTTVAPLTQELAQQFRDLPGSPTEREINEARKKHLREKFLSGVVIPFQWVTATLDGRKYRMNGQHSSAVLCEMDGAFPTDAKVVLSEYSVQNKEGLAQLFRQWDDRRSARSTSDVAGAFQGLVQELADVPRSLAKHAIDGIAWWRQNVEDAPTPSGDDKYSLFYNANYHKFVRFIGELLADSKAPELQKPPVVAAIYATFEANEQEARTFWDSISRKGDQYNDSAPTTVLDLWLVSIHKENPEEIRPGGIYRGCVFGWNAHRADRDITRIKHDTRSIPEVSE